MNSDELKEKEEYSIIRLPFELISHQDNLEERFNKYWKDWIKMCESRGVDK